MKYGRKFLGMLLTLVLCLGVLYPAPAYAADICFTAIDESILKLTNESMPIWSGGVLYAPYTTFNKGDNGIADWEIQVLHSKTSNRALVFDKNRYLEFDLKAGTCWDDLTGIPYSGGGIVRGGLLYLPVEIVCKHFGMTYSYREIDKGDLLRIKTDGVIISDSRFADAAENILNLRLKEYNQNKPGSTQVPEVITPQPPVQKPPVESEQQVDTFLAFRCEEGAMLEQVLTILDTVQGKGMFFLTPELIEQRADLVIRVLGSGHSIGLLARGGNLEEIRRELSDGRKALAEQVFYAPTVAFVPKDFRDTMEQEGWVCWNSTLDLTPEDTAGANYFSNRVISQLGNRTRDTYLSLNVSENTARVLPTLLRSLDEEGFELELPLETRL